MNRKLLDTINYPSDLRKLSVSQLTQLAAEIREYMIDIVSKNGGHLASSLGAVELTLALHYCYNTPTDKLIWDVGHQAYTHKIITGRKKEFETLRQFNGISGFPRSEESTYDVVSVGHASTSISVGLGIAKARDLKGEKYSVVAVIGDGSMSGGLAFEGLNNLGASNTGMTIILNDNEMSISPNVGALSRYLTRVITDKRYAKLKADIWELLGQSSVGKSIRGAVQLLDNAVKHILIPGKLFEDMGIRYLGPIDGHNIEAMVELFNSIKHQYNVPQLVHIITKKGKGYNFAEKDAVKYHGIGCFSKDTGETISNSTHSPTPSYSDVFGEAIVELAVERPNVVAITAAMREGTKLIEFSKKFPHRFFDVGIAESHAVTFASGLARNGFCPIVAIYSTFLQRSYDQIIHDVALDNLHVVFCIDRAGIVGEDGPTHHGVFDLSYLRSIPGAIIMAPSSGNELKQMLYCAIDYYKGPIFIRYPRGCTPDKPDKTICKEIPCGVPEILTKGKEIALLGVGDFLSIAHQVAEILNKEKGLQLTIVNARFVKPLDIETYTEIFSNHKLIVTLENNSIIGGYGAAIAELLHKLDIKQKPEILTFGIPDRFIPHGDNNLIFNMLGIDAYSIAKNIGEFIDNKDIIGRVKAFFTSHKS